jgi:hypothetical protein
VRKWGWGKKGGKERVFGCSNGGERIWWRENGVPTPAPMPVPMGAIGGRTGLGGKFLKGGNEIISTLFYLYFFQKKKKKKQKTDERGTDHVTFVITIASRRL